MTFLAVSANETTFWLVAGVVGAVLVLGVLALVTTLLYLVRSISLSMRQLQEVTQVQAAQVQAAQAQVAPAPGTEGDPADREPGGPSKS
ncbi:MAG TPA: hypothetical protein VFQ77_07830 [Pseudonocardiaceae bacterium]|jgi:tetrahydromethanopterin S-methyltransferase subunit D|nr:hypothetical protein [Pseudonocardiaceae bacterium]